ncbi:MAG: nucleotidyltransferase family protein [Spirochaetes bacterium]|nr:nucleotidyltransferase family protein [Spirochaetota bacterium]
MDAEEVKRTLATHPELFQEFSVHELRLFGSTLRGDAGGASDIDLLVDYTPGVQVGLFAFIRLRRRLSELLGFQVDLVTPDALHPAIREGILREAVRVT